MREMDGDILKITNEQRRKRRRKFIAYEIMEWREETTGHRTNDMVKYLNWLEKRDIFNSK
jgi:hypothetical protein